MEQFSGIGVTMAYFRGKAKIAYKRTIQFNFNSVY